MDKEYSLHPIGEELLLFLKNTRQLYALNPTAAYMWERFEEKVSREEIVKDVCSKYGAPEELVSLDVTQLQEQWRVLQEPTKVIDLELSSECSSVNSKANNLSNDLEVEEIHTSCHYQIVESCSLVSFVDQDSYEMVHPLFRHLTCSSAATPNFTVYIGKNESGYFVLRDNVTIEDGLDLDQLAPIVETEISYLSFARSKHWLAVHAAVLKKGDVGILLPAVSGSGKSTLTAFLAKNGFDYVSDDIALLDTDSSKVLAAPLCMNVKRGSWNILRRYYPEIDSIPVHRRSDGNDLKYLCAPLEFDSDSYMQTAAVRYLVIPQYVPQGETRLFPISKAEALVKLTQAGFNVSSTLDETTVRRLVSWLEGIETFSMDVNDLDRASELLSLTLEVA